MWNLNLVIGLMIGLLIGGVGMWVLDRRHQAITRKLVESRRKIERQRTQAVNDLFALRAELEDPMRQPVAAVETHATGVHDANMVAELANLRSLIARADGALTAARRKRDEHEREIARLRSILEDRKNADVIDLHRQDRSQAGGVAL